MRAESVQISPNLSNLKTRLKFLHLSVESAPIFTRKSTCTMYGDVGSSDSIARDVTSLLHSSSTFKHPPDAEFPKIKELISSDSYSNYNHHHHHQEHNHNYSQNENRNQNQTQNQNQNQQQRYDVGGETESSLTRYRSAPSSFYASLLDENDFMAPMQNSSLFQSDSNEFVQQYTKIETKEERIEIPKVNLPPVSMAMYSATSHQMPPHMPLANGSSYHNNHTNHNNLGNSRTMNSTNSNLIRQSSSPAGFLSSLNAETGYPSMRDVEKTNSSSRSNNHISFSSMPSSSSPFLPQIVENKNEINDSTLRSLKRTRDGDSKMFSSSITLDIENGSSGHYSPSLVHHMSLPKTSSEMATAEKFLRFEQDSILCKTRAKRGCATHPRSIAERVRRTRISERMKKIQALFPDMDKQTSTSDMLNLAVQYIKDLQKDLKTLKDARARCTCSTQQ